MKPSVEYRIAALLEKKNIKVSTAESCTGGLVAAALVNVAGISNWFEEGYVTYSNTAKQKLLGVDKDTLEQFGAVSEQTARQMAIGAAKAAGCQAAVATTGIAGPDGGTDEKPVGLVYIGAVVRDDVVIEKHIFKGDRADVRKQSTQAALELLEQMLEKD
ncbi:MAG: CinA family protein [Lachnospiraceae bacterium]|nr:CinA family protein [Lachnospiraceae bacterium]